eukprot:397832_1
MKQHQLTEVLYSECKQFEQSDTFKELLREFHHISYWTDFKNITNEPCPSCNKLIANHLLYKHLQDECLADIEYAYCNTATGLTKRDDFFEDFYQLTMKDKCPRCGINMQRKLYDNNSDRKENINDDYYHIMKCMDQLLSNNNGNNGAGVRSVFIASMSPIYPLRLTRNQYCCMVVHGCWLGQNDIEKRNQLFVICNINAITLKAAISMELNQIRDIYRENKVDENNDSYMKNEMETEMRNGQIHPWVQYEITPMPSQQYVIKLKDANISNKLVNNVNYFKTDPSEYYTYGVAIGMGYASTISVAKHKGTNLMYCVKQIEKRLMNKSKRYLKSELLTMQFVHKNIIKSIAIFDTSNIMHIIIPRHHMSLRRFIQILIKCGFGKEITEPMKLFILIEAAKGVEFLHRNKIVHRDLKPENILVSLGGVTKLIDFGIVFHKEYRKDKEPLIVMTSNVGTPCYQAEETKTGKQYTKSCDVFSFGCILFELFDPAAFAPYTQTEDVLKEAEIVVNSNNYNKQLGWMISKKTLKQILFGAPNERPSITQVKDELIDKLNK